MSQRIEFPGLQGATPRLLYLARSVPHPSSAAGASRRVAAFLEELEARGVPTLAYVGDPPVHAGSGPRAARRFLPGAVRGLRRDLSTLLAARCWTRSELPVVRSFGPTAVLERAAYLDDTGELIARTLGIPHVLELHGLLAGDARSYYTSPLAGLGRLREGRRYAHADATIAVSTGLAEWLVGTGVSSARVSVIPNGADPVESIARVSAAARRLRLDWELDDHLVVGWIGHLMTWQAPALVRLAEALDRLRDRFPVALVVVAPHEEGVVLARGALHGRVAIPVRFVGEAAGDRAAAAVRAFDLGVIPDARPYDLPVKLFHYGALGVPVVAPDAASIVAFDEQRLLYLFRGGDQESLAEVVARALGDPDLTRRGEQLRALVEARYTWPSVVERTLEVVAACGG